MVGGEKGSKDDSNQENGITESIESPSDTIQSTDDLFKLCGDAGPWQLRVYFLAVFAGIPAAIQDFLYVFMAATPNHWCKVVKDDCPNFSYDELKNMSIPSKLVNGQLEFEQCHRYVSVTHPQCSSPDLFPRYLNSTESCPGYDFDNGTFEATIVTEWDLVCEDAVWSSTAQAVYAMGSLTGSIVIGIISDNFGRKKAVLISLLISLIFGPIVAYSPTYATMLAGRFFIAIGSPGIYDCSYILMIEMIAPSWRGLAGSSFAIPYSLGYASLAGIAYLVRNWRHLQLVLTIPAILYLFVMYFIPESPRFLISNGNLVQAEKILRDIATTNGKILPSNFTQLVNQLYTKKKGDGDESSTKKLWWQEFLQCFKTFWDLFRTPKMRLRTLVLNFCWLSVCLVYFGVALNAPNLSANLFLYSLLTALLEIPSYLMVPPLIKYIGRRFVFSGLLLICSAALTLSLLFEPGSTGIIVLSLVGLFHIGSSYGLMYLFLSEIIPTNLRSYGIGSAAVSGKIANAAAPYITTLVYNKKAPAMAFAAVSFLASLLSLLLPETRNRKLPDTVEDVENS